MAGTIPLSLTQQFDELGNVLAGGKLYLIEAGTVATPQNGYQDSALTIPWPNPIILDAAGRLPQFFLADGSIKVRLTDVNGVNQFTADGILVVGASSGGGGGSPVDATTLWQTGDLKPRYGTGVHSGFVRANGRTIGSSTSGGTERANADTQALFEYLYDADLNLSVSGGRGASAAADWAANKTIALPDFRGRVLAALDDMGNTSAGRLTILSNTTLGAAGGAQSVTLTLAQLPTGITSSNLGAIALSVVSTVTGIMSGAIASAFGGGSNNYTPQGTVLGAITSTGNIPIGDADVTSNNTSGSDHANLQPTILITYYVKL